MARLSDHRIHCAGAIIALEMIATPFLVYAGEDTHRDNVVVCISKDFTPWVSEETGNLIREESNGKVNFDLNIRGRNFSWLMINHIDKSHSFVGPGPLLEMFVPDSERQQQIPRGPLNIVEAYREIEQRGQLRHGSGEIYEYSGTTRLLLAFGSKCPKESPRKTSKYISEGWR